MRVGGVRVMCVCVSGCVRHVHVRDVHCATCVRVRVRAHVMCGWGGARAVCAALGCVFPPGPTPGLQAGPGAAVPALTRPSRPRAAPVSPLQFLHYPADTRVMGDLMQNPELVPHRTENFSQSHK